MSQMSDEILFECINSQNDKMCKMASNVSFFIKDSCDIDSSLSQLNYFKEEISRLEWLLREAKEKANNAAREG